MSGFATTSDKIKSSSVITLRLAVTAEDNDHLKVSDRSVPECGELLKSLKLSTERTGRAVDLTS